MRLFIAVCFDDRTIETLRSVQRRLREWGHGNFSRPENLHLTLAFLGEVDPHRLEAVHAAMDSVTMPDLRLQFTHTGRFRRKDGDIWWVGLAPNRALSQLHHALAQQLALRGFILEARQFSPHITLARQLLLHREPNQAHLLGAPFETSADTLSLMRSHRVNGILTYTEQYAVKAPDIISAGNPAAPIQGNTTS